MHPYETSFLNKITVSEPGWEVGEESHTGAFWLYFDHHDIVSHSYVRILACFDRRLSCMKANIIKQISQGDKSGGISYGWILACFDRNLFCIKANITQQISQGDKSGGISYGCILACDNRNLSCIKSKHY